MLPEHLRASGMVSALASGAEKFAGCVTDLDFSLAAEYVCMNF